MTSSQMYDSPGSRHPQQRVDRRLDSPGQLAIVAVVVWLVGAIIHPLAFLTGLGGLLLLVALVAYLLRPRSHSMYWRGRQIDLDDRPRPAQELYRRIFKH